MAYKHTPKYTSDRLEDYIIYCDICGNPTWYSDAKLLDAYTGRGGLLVCPNDNDAIDYGLVPYEIPSESTVPQIRINETFYTSNPPTTYDPFNYADIDPMSISDPAAFRSLTLVWEDQFLSWDAKSSRWDEGVPGTSSSDWDALTTTNWESLTTINWEDMIS